MKGKQASAIFKMAIGTMIMGLGFVFMVLAAQEGAPQEELGKRAEAVVLAAGGPSESSTFWELAQASSESSQLNELVETESDRILAGVDDPESLRPSIQAGLWATATSTTDRSAATKESRAEAVTAIAEASYGSAVHASTAMFWLILAYLFHTIGELCSSPVALSFITKLSPARYGSLMMGLYFAVMGAGNYLASLIGQQVENFDEFTIFAGITLFTVFFGALLLIFLKPLNRRTHGAEDISEVVDKG